MLEAGMSQPDEWSGNAHQHMARDAEEQWHLAQVCLHMTHRAAVVAGAVMFEELKRMDVRMAHLHQQEEAGNKPTNRPPSAKSVRCLFKHPKSPSACAASDHRRNPCEHVRGEPWTSARTLVLASLYGQRHLLRLSEAPLVPSPRGKSRQRANIVAGRVRVKHYQLHLSPSPVPRSFTTSFDRLGVMVVIIVVRRGIHEE